MLYLVSGRDEFRREEFIGQLKTLMRRLPAGEHNIVELEARTPVAELITACNTTPFLCEKRMVIARGVASQVRRGPAGQELLDYLPHLPDTTHLVLAEDDDSALQPFAGARKDVVARQFPRLRPDHVPPWIRERARTQGSRMSTEAARLLAEMVGTDLRLIDSEIAKLGSYVDRDGTVGVDEVRTLVHGAAPDIFTWHDAVAEQRAGTALAATQALLDTGSEPAELFAQLAALVRRLLIVKELMAEDRSIAREGPPFGLSSSSFAQDKLRRQAARLSTVQLDRAYELLHETDLAIKTGRLDAELALELAVAQLTGIEPAQGPRPEGNLDFSRSSMVTALTEEER